jgi:hypothetical protein
MGARLEAIVQARVGDLTIARVGVNPGERLGMDTAGVREPASRAREIPK